MKLNKSQKNKIKKNYKQMSPKELAAKINVGEDVVLKFMKRANLQKKTAKNNLFKPSLQGKSLQELKEYVIDNLAYFLGFTVSGILIYFNSLGGRFVSDDIVGYVNNEITYNFMSALRAGFFQNIFYSIYRLAFGINPIPFHITSLLLHILTASLLFIFLSLILNKKISGAASFLFLVHPVNSEAVSWISGVNYILNGILFYVTAISFIMYRRGANYKYLLISFVTYFVTSYSFPSSFSILTPLMIIVIDYFLLETKFTVKNIFVYLSYFVSTFVFLLRIRSDIGPRVSGLNTLTEGASVSYLLKSVYSAYNIAKLLTFPAKLTLYHEGEIISSAYARYMTIVVVLLLGLLAYFVKKYRKLAGVYILIPMSVAILFSPVQVSWYVAERYLYIASAMFCVLVVLLVYQLESVFNIDKLGLYLIAVLLLVYSLRAVVRTNDWKTPDNLWFATAKVSPNSAKVHNNLGDVYSRQGDNVKAAKEFQKAIALAGGNYADASHNLGLAYLRMNMVDLAKESFTEAGNLNPNLWQSFLNLGYIEYQQKNNEKAREYMLKVLEIDQKNAQALEFLNQL